MARMWARALMALARRMMSCSCASLTRAHFVEQAAQVALLLGAQSAVTHTRAHRLQPAIHQTLQPGVDGKGVPNGAAVFQQLGHVRGHLANRQSPVHAQCSRCCFWPQADAVPDFALQVFGLAKQRALAIGRDHQTGVRLCEAGQVIKVAVVPVQVIAVAVALALGRGGDDGNAACTQLGSEAGTALGVEQGGVIWSLEIRPKRSRHYVRCPGMANVPHESPGCLIRHCCH